MSLKSKILFSLFTVLIIGGCACVALRRHLAIQLNEYVSQKTEKSFGALPLNTDQEEKIRAIASEIGVAQPFTIRKMNQRAMMTFGYHNAFVYFPLLFSCIPTNSSPYLFISEGFLEDLSPEEQRFLIGHEMIHIKESHTLYLNLFLYLFLALLLILSYLLTKKIHNIAQAMHHKKYIIGAFCCIAGFTSFFVPTLIALAYRRHIEKVADCRSLQVLKTYEGCAKIIARWEKEFNLPAHNPYFGLLSDHPSCEERKLYCLNLQNNSKDIV
ncbi:MAG TPA: M48 family metalloprotease [Candidatus Babeliales bacterium]|nr:M48 family metalloprotease [Candidatus Babeliales bacterium]